MHDPEGYFPRRFINDFEAFWLALERYGSLSSGRIDGESCFAAEDFAIRHDGVDLLHEIHKARRVPFMYGMMFSVLMDQLFFTHFGAMYPSWDLSLFQQGHRMGLTSHPKMWCDDQSGPKHAMERPWLIFSHANLLSRHWKESDAVTGFRPYADVMVSRWGQLIDTGTLPDLEWAQIVEALRRDPHIHLSPFGRAIVESAIARQWSRSHAA